MITERVGVAQRCRPKQQLIMTKVLSGVGARSKTLFMEKNADTSEQSRCHVFNHGTMINTANFSNFQAL